MRPFEHLTLCALRTLSCILCVLSFMETVHAQSSRAIHWMGAELGLSNNTIQGLAVDKRGFIWVSTDDGLNKFDGNGFRVFRKSKLKTNTLPANELNGLADDATDPLLWIATQRDGLCCYDYDSHRFTTYKHSDDEGSIVDNSITSVFNSRDGNIWLTSYWGGLDCYDKKNRRFVHYNRKTVPSLADQQLWTMAEDADGTLYLGHVSHGFTVLNPHTRKADNYLPSDLPGSIAGTEVRTILCDSYGNVWIGSNYGLSLYNKDTHTFFNFGAVSKTLGSRINDIKQISPHEIWLATNHSYIVVLTVNGKVRQPETVPVRYILVDKTLPSNNMTRINCLLRDRSGNVWGGTREQGLVFLSHCEPLFNTLRYSSDVSIRNRLWSKPADGIGFDSSGRMYVGSHGDGVGIYEQGLFYEDFNKHNGRFDYNYVTNVFCDSQGDLWIGASPQGVHLLRKGEKQPREVQGCSEARFFSESDGMIYAGTSEGVYVINRATAQVVNRFKCDVPYVWAVVTDASNRIWMGTFGGGLYILDNTGKQLRHYITDGGFPSNSVFDICCASDGTVYVATGEGVASFAPGQIDRYTLWDETKGLDNDCIHSVIEDRQHNVWMATNNGLSCLLLATGQFINFGNSENVPRTFCDASRAMAPNGWLYFGSSEGICYFNPSYVLGQKEQPRAVITRLMIPLPSTIRNYADSVIYIDGSVSECRLHYTESTFSIEFAAADFALSHQMEFEYCMKGLDDNWHAADDNNRVNFAGLSPGSYVFQLRSRMHNQPWGDSVQELAIIIAPPFWLTWWAKLFYALLVAAIVFTIMFFWKRKMQLETQVNTERQNTERQKLFNEERMTFYTNITHELRTPLTLIIGPLEDMLNAGNLPEKESGRIALIRKQAQRLLSLVNRMLEFRKVETGNRQLKLSRRDVCQIVSEVYYKYETLNSNPELTFRLHLAPAHLPMLVDAEVLTIILDNLISNAVKYTPSGTITVSLAQHTDASPLPNRSGAVEIKVTDTGYGMSAEACKRIFERYYQVGGEHQAEGSGIGMSLAQSLTTLHKGTLSVESEEGKGSCFTLCLPISDSLSDSVYEGQVEEPEEGYATEVPIEPPVIDDNKPTLLVVDDNHDIRQFVAETFAEEFNIVQAANGQQALEEARRYMPSIVVSDVMMPVMNGVEFCRHLKSELQTSHIPVILLTAKVGMCEQEAGYNAGADSYIPKPFTSTLIRSRVFNIVEQRRMLSEMFTSTRQLPVAGEEAQHIISEIERKHEMLMESIGEIDRRFIERISKYIEDNISSEDVDVGNLAQQMSMSTSSLYRKLKGLTGLSPKEFITKQKMTHAERLMLRGEMSISEVGYSVGYNQLASFRKAFKDEFGLLPSEYLDRIKQPSA